MVYSDNDDFDPDITPCFEDDCPDCRDFQERHDAQAATIANLVGRIKSLRADDAEIKELKEEYLTVTAELRRKANANKYLQDAMVKLQARLLNQGKTIEEYQSRALHHQTEIEGLRAELEAYYDAEAAWPPSVLTAELADLAAKAGADAAKKLQDDRTAELDDWVTAYHEQAKQLEAARDHVTTLQLHTRALEDSQGFWVSGLAFAVTAAVATAVATAVGALVPWSTLIGVVTGVFGG
jgi:chromosome segregation ATPase